MPFNSFEIFSYHKIPIQLNVFVQLSSIELSALKSLTANIYYSEIKGYPSSVLLKRQKLRLNI